MYWCECCSRGEGKRVEPAWGREKHVKPLRIYSTKSTHGAWNWHTAWTPRGKDTSLTVYYY